MYTLVDDKLWELSKKWQNVRDLGPSRQVSQPDAILLGPASNKALWNVGESCLRRELGYKGWQGHLVLLRFWVPWVHTSVQYLTFKAIFSIEERQLQHLVDTKWRQLFLLHIKLGLKFKRLCLRLHLIGYTKILFSVWLNICMNRKCNHKVLVKENRQCWI